MYNMHKNLDTIVGLYSSVGSPESEFEYVYESALGGKISGGLIHTDKDS